MSRNTGKATTRPQSSIFPIWKNLMFVMKAKAYTNSKTTMPINHMFATLPINCQCQRISQGKIEQRVEDVGVRCWVHVMSSSSGAGRNTFQKMREIFLEMGDKYSRCWVHVMSSPSKRCWLLADRTQPALLQMSAGEAGRTFCKQTGNTFHKMREIFLKIGDKYSRCGRSEKSN